MASLTVGSASLAKDLGALSLEEGGKKVSKETLTRFLNEPTVVGHIGSFFCETNEDLTTFCTVAKVCNKVLARCAIFSGNSPLVQLAYMHCQRKDADRVNMIFLSMLWDRMKNNTRPDDEDDEALLERTFKNEACRNELVRLAWQVVLRKACPDLLSQWDVPRLKWLQKFDSRVRLQERILGISKTITSWTFSSESGVINGDVVKNVLTTFPMIRRTTLAPHSHGFSGDVLQAHVGFPIEEVTLQMDLKPQDFSHLGKMTTLQKLTLVGGVFYHNYFGLLGAHPNLTFLNLGGSATDADLKCCMQFSKLQSVTLPMPRITDKAFHFLEKMNLTELEITYGEFDDSNQISDEGLKCLSEQKLRRLILRGCKKVSGGFLAHFRHPKCLDELDLTGTWLNSFDLNRKEHRAVYEEKYKLLAQKVPHLAPLEDAPLHFVRKVVHRQFQNG